MNHEQVALEVFRMVRDKDLSLVDLYHDDAVVYLQDREFRGRSEIRALYEGAMVGVVPRPVRTVSQGEFVAVEVRADISASEEISERLGVSLSPVGAERGIVAVDLFEFEGGKIRSLKIFIGGPYPSV